MTIRAMAAQGVEQAGSAMAGTSVHPGMRAYLNDCTRRGGRPSAIDAAQHAKRKRIGLEDFLTVMPALHRASGAVDSAPSELGEFVLTLGGEKPGRVLEIGDDGAFYAAGLLAGGSHVSLATRSAEIAEAVAVLADPDRFSACPFDSLDANGSYDFIVAHPPVHGKPVGIKDADGFGSELAARVAALLADHGRLVWISGRQLISRRARLPSILADCGLGLRAVLDLPTGWCPMANIEGMALVFDRSPPGGKLMGWMREAGSGRAFAECLVRGSTKRIPPNSFWDKGGQAGSYRDHEDRRLVEKLMPKGKFRRVEFGKLLVQPWQKADKPTTLDDPVASFIYVPEYTASRVTADLAEQTVKPNAVYRFAIDPTQVDARFLVHLLNSPYGRALRHQVADGTVTRIYPNLLERQLLPLPDLPVQMRIVSMYDDVGSLESALADRLKTLESNWHGLGEVYDDLNGMKAVVIDERRIEEWWRELPYPLATIYRRYRMSADPHVRLEKLLHFFEVFAVYLAAIACGHLRTLRSDADVVLDSLLHPVGAAGIERADFGFWIGLVKGCGKELKRTIGDRDLRVAAIDYAGAPFISIAEGLIDLGQVASHLDAPRMIRNGKAHGGHTKDSDAELLLSELESSISTLYFGSSTMLRSMKLVRVGRCENQGGQSAYEAEILQGSDPTFEERSISVARRVDARSLAFWHEEQNDLVSEVPFFHLRAPSDPAELTVYVYNRKEGERLRWVSYQEASEQVIHTDAATMRGIGRLLA